MTCKVCEKMYKIKKKYFSYFKHVVYFVFLLKCINNFKSIICRSIFLNKKKNQNYFYPKVAFSTFLEGNETLFIE